MESLEEKFNEDFLYRMRDEVLQKVEKSAEFQVLSREADTLSGKFPVITDLFEGTHMEESHELTREERQAIRKYVELHSRIMEMHEFAHYYRGHGDCILHLKRCGLLDGKEENRLSIKTMADLIRIHDAYKALNKALFGTEMTLLFHEGYIGALGRIYKVIGNHTTENMKSVSTQILADTSIEPEMRAKMLLQGDNS